MGVVRHTPPAPPGAGGAAEEEEGDVAAEGEGEGGDPLLRDGPAEERVDGPKGGGGVAGSPAEAGAGGDALRETEADPLPGAGLVEEEAGRPGGEVLRARGDLRVRFAAGEGQLQGDGTAGGEGGLDVIRGARGDHDGVDVVVPVGAPGEDLEEEVELGGTGEGDGCGDRGGHQPREGAGTLRGVPATTFSSGITRFFESTKATFGTKARASASSSRP